MAYLAKFGKAYNVKILQLIYTPSVTKRERVIVYNVSP
jgi:hypothetical protein